MLLKENSMSHFGIVTHPLPATDPYGVFGMWFFQWKCYRAFHSLCMLFNFPFLWACLFQKWVRSERFFGFLRGSLCTCQTLKHTGVTYSLCDEKNSQLISKHSRTWTEKRWQSSSIHNVSTSDTFTCSFERRTQIFLKHLVTQVVNLTELVYTVLQFLIYVLLRSTFMFEGQLCLFSILMMFHVFPSVIQVAALIQYVIENTPAIFGDDLESLFTRQMNTEQERCDYTGNCKVMPFGPHITVI